MSKSTTFDGKGIVWDPNQGKAICTFSKNIDPEKLGTFSTDDPAVIERMEALGYVGRPTPKVKPGDTPLSADDALLESKVMAVVQQFYDYVGVKDADELMDKLKDVKDLQTDFEKVEAELTAQRQVGVDASAKIIELEAALAEALKPKTGSGTDAKAADTTTDAGKAKAKP